MGRVQCDLGWSASVSVWTCGPFTAPLGFRRLTSFQRPRPLSAEVTTTGFDCGEVSLNEWLQTRALRSETTGASRTFVSLTGDGEVAGYYCLSASSLSIEDAPGRLRRNMPNPIPVILIGRLAVDHRFKGQGLGGSLLQEAMLKGMEAARLVGARALVVDALSEDAVRFYQRYGFELMPPNSKRAMYLLVSDAEKTVAELT